jgi:hypothetical protein
MGSKYAVGRRCTPSDIFWSVLHHPEKFTIMHASVCMGHPKEDSMTLMNLRLLAARAGVMSLVKTALFSVVLAALAPAPVVAQPMEKKGTTPYVTHFIFRPLMSIDIPGLGTATNLEAVGTTQKTGNT